MVEKPTAEEVVHQLAFMQITIQELQAQIQQPVHLALPPVHLKHIKPEKWDRRKGFASTWLASIEDIFTDAHTEEQKIRYAASYLTFQASDW